MYIKFEMLTYVVKAVRNLVANNGADTAVIQGTRNIHENIYT